MDGLAKEVLFEIPKQFGTYMQKHNIKPLAKNEAQDSVPSVPVS